MTDNGLLVLPSLQSVLTLVVGLPAGGAKSVASRLTALYAPVLGAGTSTLSAEHKMSMATVFVTGAGLPASLPATVVLGLPADGDRVGLCRRLDQLFEQPRGSDLRGPFVALRLGPDSVDLVTAAHAIRPIHHVSGAEATVWSTRALAAHCAAGVTPRISTEAVPDLILLDYVLGDDDLFDAATVPADALHVSATRAGVRATHWQTAAERFAPGPPTRAATLRAVVGDEMGRVAELPGAMLGLTAGRDSNLALSCLHERGGRMQTFTLSWPGDSDAEGAEAAASATGCPHTAVPPIVHDLADGRWLDATRWTEGQVMARNLLIAGFDWPTRGVTWVSGSGGEIGRAFYGRYFADGGPPRDRWRAHFVDPYRALLVRPVLDLFEARVGQAMHEAWSVRPDAVGSADVFYVSNRMGKWFGRRAHTEQLAGLHPVYLAPQIATVLLDIPEPGRLSGRVFDEALAIGPLDLHAVATAAVQRQFGGGPAAGAPSWRRRSTRLMPRALRSLARTGVTRLQRGHGAPHPEWAQLEPLCRELEVEGSIVIEVMGGAWWRHQLASAPHWDADAARRALWNAVSVDALQRQLPQLSSLMEAPRPTSTGLEAGASA